MTFQPAPDIVRCDLIWADNAARQWMNTLHFEKTSYSLSDMQELVADLETAIDGNSSLAFLSNTCQLDRVRLTDIRTDDGPVVEETMDEAGLATADAIPYGSAAVVTLRTAKRGRSYRGRLYWSGLGENGVSGQGITQAFQDYILDFLDDLVVAAEADGWTLVVLSRQYNQQIRLEAVGEPVTARVIRSTLLGSQRRRNDRG